MRKDKAIVISVDAMTGEDLEKLSGRRNTSRLLSLSSLVEKTECVLPSYTYPCHAAILTGCYPDRNGIYHNEILAPPYEENEWFWWADCHKRRTIVDEARLHGLVTASVSWPTLAGKAADYTIPEIWPTGRCTDREEMYRKAVSPSAWQIFSRYRKIIEERKRRFYDIYSVSASTDIIREHFPDLTLIHLSEIDTVKHESGCRSKKLEEACDFIDDALGRIMDAAESTGKGGDTTYFLLGDHGQKDVGRVFSINRVLMEKGYVDTDGKRITGYRMLIQPAAFTALVFLRGISEEDAAAVLEDIRREYPGTIDRILTKREAEENWHLSGPFSLVLLNRSSLIFSFSPFLPVMMDRENAIRYGFPVSAHGYAPGDGPSPPFLVSGRRSAKGVRIQKARLVDEGPTILSLFGITMDDTDGKVIDGLIRADE